MTAKPSTAIEPAGTLISRPAVRGRLAYEQKISKTSKKRTHPKIKLGLPDLDQAKAAVLGSLRSSESQRAYRHSIDEFISWYCSDPHLSFNKTVVTRYRIHPKHRFGDLSKQCPPQNDP